MMQDKKEEYQSLGYFEISTDSGTGSTILVNDELKRVVKINQDTAYNVFVDFAKDNVSLCVPQVHEFKKYGVAPFEGHKGFTIIEMEKLISLGPEEAKKYEDWISAYWIHNQKSTVSSDDFGLLETIEALLEHAKNNKVNIDLNKSTNVMKRSSGEYVITDPYN